MMQGKIVKIVSSYGSRWGRIQPNGTTREVFFNSASLTGGAVFDGLRAGQVVEFDEEMNRGTGTRAVCVVPGDLPKTVEAKLAASPLSEQGVAATRSIGKETSSWQ